MAHALRYPVTFLPGGRTVHVVAGESLLEAATLAGLTLDAPCAGGATCGKCRVRILSGEAADLGSSHRLSASERADGWRLACATSVNGPLTVDAPTASMASLYGPESVSAEPVAIQRDPKNAAADHLGMAVDLGTTTVAAALFDLRVGAELAATAIWNRQNAWGDDVISRLATVRRDPASLSRLHELAVAMLNELLTTLCEACGATPRAVRRLTVAGNTAMQQILLGMDPSPLGEKPFLPAFFDAQTLAAASIGIDAHPDAQLWVFPQIGGFVGGDTVAGLLAAQADTLTRPTLLVDIGTNGEMALVVDGAIWAASAAAGPAFEGARIQHGMRAVEGAIDQIWTRDHDLHVHVIGGGAARGLCGSALIDAAAECLRAGLLETTGALADPSTARPNLSPALAHRIRPDVSAGSRLLLADNIPPDLPVFLTQQDVRELQLASGAIRAGIEALLRKAGLVARDLDAILLAGGFGNRIRRENALRIGLLPPVDPDTVRFIGNASLTGAKRALLAGAAWTRAQHLRERATHVELAAEPAFADLFMEHIFFPEAPPT